MQRPGESLIVTTTTGGAPADWEARKYDLVERLGGLAEHALDAGVMVGIEPHVGAALHRPEDVIWLADQVDSPGLTIHFDISHFNVQGIDMADSVVLLAPRSLHTHVKDERGLAPDHEFLIPGEGEMDYPHYLRLMREAGYDGHIVVEISIMVQARPDFDGLAAATQSYSVLSRAFIDAGLEPRS
jgi:sugar phosphate isomerase/epimerase